MEGSGSLEDKFRQFLPGMPEDAGDIPSLRYQVLGGRVFTLLKWRDGSTTRGETELATLESLRGEPVTREGWYDEVGTYVGSEAWS